MNGINVGQGAVVVGKLHDFFDGIDRAHGVRSIAYRHYPGLPVDLLGQVVHVKRAVFLINLGETNGCTSFF